MVEKILNGNYLRNLDNIRQWEEKDTFNKESVSSHSYKVVVFTKIILEKLFENEIKISNEEVLEFKLECVNYAIFHDWDEALLLRDNSHELKYNNFNGDEIRKALNLFSRHMSAVEFTERGDNGEPSKTSISIIGGMFPSCPAVKSIVKLSDHLAMKYFCIREVKLGNNQIMENLIYIDSLIKLDLENLENELMSKYGVNLVLKHNIFNLTNKLIAND